MVVLVRCAVVEVLDEAISATEGGVTATASGATVAPDVEAKAF